MDKILKSAKFLLWFKDPPSFFRDIYNMEPYPYQSKILMRLTVDPFPHRLLLVGAGGCIVEGTNIQLADGSFKNIECVQNKDRLLSYIDNEIVENNVLQLHDTGIQRVLKIRNKEGVEIIGTEDHPILTPDGYVSLSKFYNQRNNLKAYFLRSYDVKDLDILDEEIILLASLISEGYYGIDQSPKVTNNNLSFLKYLSSISNYLFGIKGKLYPKENGYDLILSRERSGKSKSPIIEWLRNFGIYGDVKEHKKLPEKLFRMSNRQIQLFLEVFMFGDGSYSFAKRTNKYRFSIYTGLTLKLADDIKLLLHRIGIFPKIIVRLRENSTAPFYELRFYALLNLFHRKIGTEMSISKFYISKDIGMKHVYDIEMEGHYNYIANSMIVHNTGKTKLLACIALWLAVVYPKFLGRPYSVIIISGSKDQAKYLYEYSKFALQDTEELREEVEGEPLISITYFKDRSVIMAVPNSLKAIQGKHLDCFDPDTEVLTEQGWKYIKDIDINNDRVATLRDNEYLEYHKPIAKIEKDIHNKNLRHISNKFVDLLVTQTHKLYIKTQWKGWNLKEASYKLPRRFYMKRNCKWIGEEVELFKVGNKEYKSDDWLEFLGYYISEGSIDKHRVCLYQKDPIKRDIILNCLKRLGFNYFTSKNGCRIRFTDHNISAYLNKLGRFAWTKYIPEDIKKCNSSKLKILLNALILGDGHRKKTTITYTSSSKQLSDDVQEIAFKCGYQISCKVIDSYTKYFENNKKSYIIKKYYVATIGSNYPEVRFSKNYKKTHIRNLVKYNGKVYCIQVPNNIIFVRRNGKTCWAGNCAIVDEGALAGDFIIQDTLRIVSTSDHDLIILSGTPMVYSSTFVEYSENPERYPEWEKFTWSAKDCPNISIEKWEEAKKLPEEMFSVFWEGKAFAKTGTLIPTDEIRNASKDVPLQEPDPRYEIIAGCDWGWEHYTAIVIIQKNLENNIIYVLYTDMWRREDYEDMHQKIVQICKDYNVTKMYADASHIGENQRLLAKGINLISVPFHTNKIPMQSHMKILFHQGKIKIPEVYQPLIQQLRKYNWNTKINDDSVDALQLALKGVEEDVNQYYWEII